MFIPRPLRILVSALLASSLFAPPANAAVDTGLFGSASPTYDGIFRQSLSILAFKSAGRAVPAKAVDWLKSQQCSGGGFESYRADTSAPCRAYSLQTYSGKESNSTALAALALAAVGEVSRAKAAVGFLVRQQQSDGGIAFGKGQPSDSISTALTVAAVRAVGQSPAAVAVGGKSLLTYLRSNLLDCSATAAIRGAVSFQHSAQLAADDMTAGQVLAVLTPWPIGPSQGTAASRLTCPGEVAATTNALASAVSGYVATRLVKNGNAIPSAWGSGSDWSTTSWAVIGLAGARKAPKAVAAAIANLRANANAVVGRSGGNVDPGRTALAILALEAAGADSRAFAGHNLVADLFGELK